MPHHRGFAESLTEKLEDLVATLFLPLVRLKYSSAGLCLSILLVLCSIRSQD